MKVTLERISDGVYYQDDEGNEIIFEPGDMYHLLWQIYDKFDGEGVIIRKEDNSSGTEPNI